MSLVNEAIVRDYFESLGFLVSGPCKYMVTGKHKRAEEEIDLLVVNPLLAESRMPEHLEWTAADLRGIARAVVGIYGGHTKRFSEARLEQTPEMLNFAQEKSFDLVARRLGSRDVARILCLPRLPASGDLRHRALKMLQEKGVNGVLSFRTMLIELIARVDPGKNYEKSDILQMLRILKTYDLLKGGQLELFGKKRKKKTAPQPPPPEG
jgi:hypothetical protein